MTLQTRFPEPECPPAAAELDAIIKLLDDSTPEVRNYVSRRLALTDGDLSDWLADRDLPAGISVALSEMLRPARQRILENEWQVPAGGIGSFRDDWDAFEAALRLVSDFLHDGVTLRQPMSDVLDLLAEEAAEAGAESADELRSFLFVQGRIKAGANAGSPEELDIAAVVASGQGSDLTTGIVLLLTAVRLGLEIEPVLVGEHFCCRFHERGEPWLVLPRDRGMALPQQEFLREQGLDRATQEAFSGTATTGSVLMLMLRRLARNLAKADRADDARLIKRIIFALG